MLLGGAVAADAGVLGNNQRISSSALGYDLHYRVYVPAQASADSLLPSLYITDGQAFLQQGDFQSVLDEMITSGMLKPLIVVFVDSRDPENLQLNRRNSEFMCNESYARFFGEELIPAVSSEYPVATSRSGRVILGISFGGLNSACFGLMLPRAFGGIAMLSPASGEHLDVVRRLYSKREQLPLRFFVSVGTRNDNQAAVKRFRRALERKGYDVNYQTVNKGHDWDNWRLLLDDVLLTFFAAPEPGVSASSD